MMRTALIHYWLVGMRGGEKVLEALGELFPDADIYTHVVNPDQISDALKAHPIKTSFISKLPAATRFYQHYLPLMPLALEELDLSDYDLIISSESGPAKGVITRPDATHLCYCHSPMRYMWDQYHSYRRQAGFAARIAMPFIFHRMRQWDVTSAARVDHFVANSCFVAARIRKYYRRDASVISPPVKLDNFEVSMSNDGYYLFVGELVHYKRADLAIAACRAADRPLVVIGDGSDMPRLRAMAGKNTQFLGRVDNATLRTHYARCRALLFPGVEDFGIVPLEAMASGKPVIALNEGGALDTVIDGQTGVMFDGQTAEALREAINRFEKEEAQFDPHTIRRHADTFSRDTFKLRMKAQIDATIAENRTRLYRGTGG